MKVTIEIDDGVIPDGWEPVRIGKLRAGDFYCGTDFMAYDATPNIGKAAIVIRKKPPTARPFRDGAEFSPHRDKWVKLKGGIATFPICGVAHGAALVDKEWRDWPALYLHFVFDDGTPDGSPFGVVEVASASQGP